MDMPGAGVMGMGIRTRIAAEDITVDTVDTVGGTTAGTTTAGIADITA